MTFPATTSCTGTRFGIVARLASKVVTRFIADQTVFPSLPWAILKPRIVGRSNSGLTKASKP